LNGLDKIIQWVFFIRLAELGCPAIEVRCVCREGEQPQNLLPVKVFLVARETGTGLVGKTSAILGLLVFACRGPIGDREIDLRKGRLVDKQGIGEQKDFPGCLGVLLSGALRNNPLNDLGSCRIT
jgi:hypothetical protein